MKVKENPVLTTATGKVRIRIQATPVCRDDVEVRRGARPFAKKPPFVPGYAILGVVEEIGEGVHGFAEGDRVAALTNFGGYAEKITLDANQLVEVPPDLDAAEAVVLMLNYLVAYQTMHRLVGVQAGDKVLIIGASGGVGTAYLELGRLAGLKMIGLASPAKHSILQAYGARAVDYRSADIAAEILKAEPEGLDVVFNGMGEEYFEPGVAVLRRGGVLVHYGGPASNAHLLLLVLKLVFYNLLPNGKRIKGYGTHRGDMDEYKQDWTYLFSLLKKGKIKPVIEERLPILEAVRANELLESGKVIGNLVLLAPELL